ALAVFDDGGGPALYAGGSFQTAGGVAASNVAKWDGESWSSLSTGIDGKAVYALSVFDDGSGPALYAGGRFAVAGGSPALRIARWDGRSWSPVSSGIGTQSSNAVRCLATFDDGSGPALYAGGSFASAGGSAANDIARWDGAAWTSVSSG